MARFAFLTPGLAVAGSLTPADFADAARAGIGTIINNRPDGEEPGQLTAEEEAEYSRQAGVTYRYVPAAKYEILDDAILRPFAQTLSQALRDRKGPVLLHCRSGLRSTIMWAAIQVGAGKPLSQVLAAAKEAGFDLEAVREELAERASGACGSHGRDRAAA